MTSKKKAIWLFSGGPMQQHAAKKIIDFGYELILTDINKNCICAKYASEFIECDTFDFQKNLKAADRLKIKYEIKAGITLAADCHETVALINKHLGLSGIDPKISRICRYKNLTREILSAAGIPQPKFACVESLDQARSFLTTIGNKAVVKSTNNSGSRGFTKINSLNELTEEVFDLAISAGTTESILIEEVLAPVKNEIAELSVETLWSDGKMYWLNWVDRLFRSDLNFFPSFDEKNIPPASWGIEIGHTNPAQHSIATKNEVQEMIFNAGVAIGLNEERGGHILKADIMLTKNGPIIIELTPRLSGGWDSSATSLERGADFQSGAILLALGEKLDIEMWHNYFEFKINNLYASIWAKIPLGAKDNIGRKFSLGKDFDREKSLQLAFDNSMKNKYVI